MITTQDIKKIYEWAKETTFPLKKAPVIKGGYCNKIVYISWLKGVGKQVTIRKKLMTDEIYNIFFKRGYFICNLFEILRGNNNIPSS